MKPQNHEIDNLLSRTAAPDFENPEHQNQLRRKLTQEFAAREEAKRREPARFFGMPLYRWASALSSFLVIFIVLNLLYGDQLKIPFFNSRQPVTSEYDPTNVTVSLADLVDRFDRHAIVSFGPDGLPNSTVKVGEDPLNNFSDPTKFQVFSVGSNSATLKHPNAGLNIDDVTNFGGNGEWEEHFMPGMITVQASDGTHQTEKDILIVSPGDGANISNRGAGVAGSASGRFGAYDPRRGTTSQGDIARGYWGDGRNENAVAALWHRGGDKDVRSTTGLWFYEAEGLGRVRGLGEGRAAEAYAHIVENDFLRVTERPLSTFSIDVDTASYAIVRRHLNQGQLPPPGAVRLEELVNYFTYAYEAPSDDVPFSINYELAEAPWNPDHRLLRVGLMGREIEWEQRPSCNFVFLLDVSGSMNQPNKLPLVQQALKLLAENLGANDRAAIVVYAGASGLVLESTPGSQGERILDAIDRLKAGGSTNGGAGIQLAYKVAQENFIEGGVNRVILATDGDFNVGVTNQSELVPLIEEKAKSGVFLSVLGFGMDNLKDDTLEKLADKGNGNYAYIDNEDEAKKVFVEQISGTLITIAKDVKFQLEFNPAKISAYRLIGYENRVLAAKDFNDDTKDAGEIGAGIQVTALYELVPADRVLTQPKVDALKYQRPASLTQKAESDELLTLKLRYKAPDSDVSDKVEFPLADYAGALATASPDYLHAAAVAAFGMQLRGSKYAGEFTLDDVLELGKRGAGADAKGRRAEFLTLVEKAKQLRANIKPEKSE